MSDHPTKLYGNMEDSHDYEKVSTEANLSNISEEMLDIKYEEIQEQSITHQTHAHQQSGNKSSSYQNSPEIGRISSRVSFESLCPHCQLSCTDEQALLSHIAAVHDSVSYLHCHVCNMVCNGAYSDVELKIHLVKCHGLTAYKCNICQYKTYDFNLLIGHVSDTHMDFGETSVSKLLSCIDRPLCPYLLQAIQKMFNNLVNSDKSFKHRDQFFAAYGGNLSVKEKVMLLSSRSQNFAQSLCPANSMEPVCSNVTNTSGASVSLNNHITSDSQNESSSKELRNNVNAGLSLLDTTNENIAKGSGSSSLNVVQERGNHHQQYLSNRNIGFKQSLQPGNNLLKVHPTQNNLNEPPLITVPELSNDESVMDQMVSTTDFLLQSKGSRKRPLEQGVSPLNSKRFIVSPRFTGHSALPPGMIVYEVQHRTTQSELTPVQPSPSCPLQHTTQSELTPVQPSPSCELQRTTQSGLANIQSSPSCSSNSEKFLALYKSSSLSRSRSVSPKRCQKIEVSPRFSTCEEKSLVDRNDISLDCNRNLVVAHREDILDCSLSRIRYTLLHRFISVDEILENIKDEVETAIEKEVEVRSFVRMKILLRFQMSQFQDSGLNKRKYFYVSSSFHSFDAVSIGKVLDTIANELINNFEKPKFQGWTLNSFTNVTLILLQSICQMSSARLGSYEPWPAGVPAEHSVVNIRTGNDCVEMSMIAFFLNKNQKDKDSPFSRYRTRASAYKKWRHAFFKFPSDIKIPVAVEDFSKIEKATNTSLFLYHLKKKASGKHDVSTIRKGCAGVSEERTIHLIKIGNSNHVALIRDFHNFCNRFRQGSRAKEESCYCRFCFCSLSKDGYSKHLELCSKSKFTQNILMPKPGETLHFQNVVSLNNTCYVAYLNTASVAKTWWDADGFVHTDRQLCAYYYCILSKSGKIIKKRSEIGQYKELAMNCLVNLCTDYSKLTDELDKKVFSEPLLTKEDTKRFNEASHCQGCRKKFDEKTKKIRQYNRFKSGVYEKNKLVEGNYIAAMCTICKMRTTDKKRLLPVICWSAHSHDYRLLMQNWDKDRLEMPVVKPKNDDVLLTFSARLKRQDKGMYHGVRLINSQNFSLGSIEHCSQKFLHMNNEMDFLKSQLKNEGYDDAVALSICNGVFCFPWKFLDSFDKLSETKLPSRCYFHNQDGTVVSNDDYLHLKHFWQVSECKSLNDYLKLHLSLGLLLITEVFQSFRKTVVQDYRLDPVCFNSLPLLSMDIALYNKALEITLMHDEDMLNLFEKNMREGLVSVVQPYVVYNNKYFPDFKENEPKLSGLLLQFNSIYETVLSSKLPYDGITVLTKEEVDKFDIIKEHCDGEYTYALEIDYTIPEEVKRRTDDLPLGVVHKAPQLDDMSPFTCHLLQAVSVGRRQRCEKLVVCHEDQQHYLMSLELLQLLVCLGLEVKKVHKIIRFKQKYAFRDFISKNVDKLKSSFAYDPSVYHKMSKSVYDNLSFSAKNDEICHFYTSRHKFYNSLARPLLRRCYKISETEEMNSYGLDDLHQRYPIYVGFFVQEKIRCMVYHLFYNVLRKHYADNVTLVCCHTDTMLLSFKNVDDIFEEMKKSPLKDSLDTSNFATGHSLYSEEREGALGLLKSVNLQQLPQEVVAFQPLLYSILLRDASEMNCSGATNSSKGGNSLHHERMKNIHMKVKNLKHCNSTKFCQCSEAVKANWSREFLPKLDDRRYYVNAEKTLAYGHPDIPKPEQ